MKAKPRKRTGLCTVCRGYKQLTLTGLIKEHKRHDMPCAGSWQPPKLPEPKTLEKQAWSAVRKAAIARDGHCRKCGSPTGLEVHHVKERVFGGPDDLSNLVTLCNDCHVEWTWCEPPIALEEWLHIPPNRMLVLLFSREWPADISASAFKEQALIAMSLALNDINERKRAGT